MIHNKECSIKNAYNSTMKWTISITVLGNKITTLQKFKGHMK